MTHVEDELLRRWQDLKKDGVPPRERFNDTTIRELELKLKAVRESMKERKS